MLQPWAALALGSLPSGASVSSFRALCWEGPSIGGAYKINNGQSSVLELPPLHILNLLHFIFDLPPLHIRHNHGRQTFATALPTSKG